MKLYFKMFIALVSLRAVGTIGAAELSDTEVKKSVSGREPEVEILGYVMRKNSLEVHRNESKDINKWRPLNEAKISIVSLDGKFRLVSISNGSWSHIFGANVLPDGTIQNRQSCFFGEDAIKGVAIMKKLALELYATKPEMQALLPEKHVSVAKRQSSVLGKRKKTR